MAKRITTEVIKYFFGLFSDLDINRLVDTSSLFEYLSSLKTERDLAPSTVCDKLRHIELAVEYVQCKHSKDIDNLDQKSEKAIKWLKQRSKTSKNIGDQRAQSSIEVKNVLM